MLRRLLAMLFPNRKPPSDYWEVLESYWESTDISAEPEEFVVQFERMPVVPRTLFAAHWAVSEVKNGALPQFFYNSTGILAPEAVVALRTLGFEETASALEQAMSEFGGAYPRDRETRIAMIEQVYNKPLSPDALALLDRMLTYTDDFLDGLGHRCRDFDVRASEYARSAGRST